MINFNKAEASFAFDMYGCPNRCRHCWLGCASNKIMPQEDVYNEFIRIREHVEKGLEKPYLEKIKYFSSWFREPDYSDDYKELFEKELEFNGGENERKDYELLSIWRLARDDNYVKWAKEIGTEKCQITLFGMGETTDWFYRRKGAFKEAITAMMKLIDVGIKPRWQLIQTKKIINELDDILNLVDKLELKKRVKELGSDFELFMHDPTPTGEAMKLEYLRLMDKDIKNIPSIIIESTEKHFGKKIDYHTEKYWVERILNERDKAIDFSFPDKLWFYVNSNWDVYSNLSSLNPWWRLGNLKKDSLHDIFSAFYEGKILGLKVLKNVSKKELVQRYGDIKSNKIYMSESDLIGLYIEKYCEEEELI